jgi:hypothetical protein
LEAIAESYIVRIPISRNPIKLSFPDWEKVRLFRRDAEGKTREIFVNMAEILNGHAKDLPLEWGDAVDIPEREHPVNENWEGLSQYEKERFNALLKCHITVEAGDKTNQVIWLPFRVDDAHSFGDKSENVVAGKSAKIGLDEFLPPANLYKPDGDPSRLTVIRTDPITGQRKEIQLDALRGTPNNWVWLRDGDILRFSDRTR